jgi:hypothetical protein
MATTSPAGSVRPATSAGAGAEPIGPNPSGVLNALVMEIARALGENPREVNQQLNQRIGVESRVNQREDVIRGAVVIAREWLRSIDPQ